MQEMLIKIKTISHSLYIIMYSVSPEEHLEHVWCILYYLKL